MRPDYTTDSLRHTLSVLASTVAIGALLVLPMNARALSCAPRVFTLSEAYDAADSIIVGLVTECEEEVSREPWANGGSDCSFVSLDVLKESNSARDYRGVSSSSGCGLSLQVGKQYLLFLDNENRPMHYSASLNGEQYSTQLSNSYQRILRDFRDGVIRDLSEPWMFGEYEGACSLSHNVGGHRITIGRGAPDAEEQSALDWTSETVDGKTTYRGQTRAVGASSSSPLLDVEVVVVGDLPEYPIDTQMLTISFQEQAPAPVRRATISVGSKSWPLYRVEKLISISGMPDINRVSYQVGGEVSEQILSAMSKPSDVVVSAVLVNSPHVDSESPPGVSQLDEGSVILAPQGDDYFSQVPPRSGSANPETTSSGAAIRAYGSRREPPEAVLRLETGSTQLPAVLKNYQACYEGVER
jgi:hypothetical protein